MATAPWFTLDGRHARIATRRDRSAAAMNWLALTYAFKPHEGEVWELHRTKAGFTLRDGEGGVAGTFPNGEAVHRFRFPSFWASVPHLEIQTRDGLTHRFKPDKEILPTVRAWVDEAVSRDAST